MAILQTTDKWTATKAFINVWLKDPRLYCNYCGQDYHSCCEAPRPVLIKRTKDDGSEKQEAVILHCKNCGSEVWQCCENPQIGNNKDHTYALIQQNKKITQTRQNELASNKDKSMRLGLSLPPRLYQDLDSYFKKTYDEKLFNTPKEMREFMKRFPAFRIAEKI